MTGAPVPTLELTGSTIACWVPLGSRARGTTAEVERMAEHVARIAHRRHVTIGTHTKGGRAHGGRRRRIDIVPVAGLTSYATAMHELGHVLGAGRSAPRLEAEANAWAWAERNRLAFTGRDELGAAWELVQADALLSYLRWCCRRNDWVVTERRVELPGTLVPPPAGEAAGLEVVVEVGTVRPGCPSLPPEGHVFWRMLQGQLDDEDSSMLLYDDGGVGL